MPDDYVKTENNFVKLVKIKIKHKYKTLQTKSSKTYCTLIKDR